MPRIPVYDSNAQSNVPRLSPGAMAAPWEAVRQLGGDISQTFGHVGSVFNEIAQREAQMVRKLKAAEIESTVEEHYSQAAFGLRELARDDYDKYNERVIGEIETSASGMAKDDPELAAAVKTHLVRKRTDFLNTSRASKYQKMGQEAEANIERDKINAYDSYARAATPEERQATRNELEIRILGYVDDGLIDPKIHITTMETFDNTAEAVRAERDMEEIGPWKTEERLRAGEYELNPTIKQDFIDKAKTKQKQEEAEARIRQNQYEADLEKAERKAHDDEENAVAGLFLQGDYAGALKLVHNSKQLKGNERVTWAKAIEQSSKTFDIPDSVVSAEIVKINDMISGEENPEEIKKYIVQTPNLQKEDKEQYLLKLSSNLSSEVETGRKAGYQNIKDLIIPKRGLQADLLETPLETQAVMRSQMQLDMWIDEQRKQKKSPTKREIQTKAMQIAEDNQITMVQKIEYERKQGEKTKKELNKYSEENE